MHAVRGSQAVMRNTLDTRSTVQIAGARRQRVAQATPASRKARFSFSISRAITRRWISCVPS